MRAFALTLIISSLALWAGSKEDVNMFGEPEKISKAFSEIAERLAAVDCLDLAFTSTVHSLQGDVIQSGTVVQEPPYRFRSDVYTYAMEGITRAHELTLSNGTNGWEISIACSAPRPIF